MPITDYLTDPNYIELTMTHPLCVGNVYTYSLLTAHKF